MNDPKQRLQELLDGVLDDTRPDRERRELSALLESHPEFVAELVEQLRTHSLLQWQCNEIKLQLAPDSTATSFEDAADASTKYAADKRRRIPLGRIWAASAAAALLMIFAYWGITRLDESGSAAVAEVVGDDATADWADDNTALADKARIVPGRLSMKSGSVTLRFRSGATVTVTGAATMQIKSDMLVRLISGQATAHVPEWAKGFTIETQGAEVIDLGTQFGVVARKDGDTDVVVFEGEVDVKPIPSAGPQRRLIQGEAARISMGGAIERISEVRRDLRGELWSTDPACIGDCTIRSIRDNIEPADSSKYYQVTARGFNEDVRAYVDRVHQWNALSSAGLPDFLSQADYVRTFNDYKYRNDLEIVLDLARPAIVYIFFDNRVHAPEWLIKQFENTGVDIGLDEGPWEGRETLSVDVGAGNSIDTKFSVWRRRCESAGTLVFGPVGEGSGARAIYGIAAKPID